ncbi:MAG: hypothetical protein Q9M48_02505 [Rhodobacterales bacterium]|nr:hypothetical protein [Rhodobacterales bacterium]
MRATALGATTPIGALWGAACCDPQRTGKPRRISPKYSWLLLENVGQASAPRGFATLAGFEGFGGVGFAGFATRRNVGFTAGFGAGARAGTARRTTGTCTTGFGATGVLATLATRATGFGATGVLATRATRATGFGAGVGLAAGFGAGFGVGFGVGAEAAATAFPSVGWKPQTTVRFRATRGTHLTLPSIPARM